MRTCAQCGANIDHKRSHAQYCDRSCKTRASDARRIADGRSRERDRARYASPERREYMQEYMQEYNKRPERREYRREYDKRPERREYYRVRYQTEAEHRRAYARQYLKDNPERMRVVRLRRKGRIRGQSYLFTEKDWRRLVARYRGCCAYCGERAPLQREHVIPLCLGGSHSVGNILPACAPCNSRKHRKLLAAWRYRSPGRDLIL